MKRFSTCFWFLGGVLFPQGFCLSVACFRRVRRNGAVGDGLTTSLVSLTFSLTPAAVRVSSDVFISTTGGADYDFAAQSQSRGVTVAQIRLDFEGGIFVLDDIGGGLALIDTGAKWRVGMYQNVAVEINPATNTQRYFLNNAPIYTGAGGRISTATTEQIVVSGNNFQLPGEFADFDTVAVVVLPEAGAEWLLCAGMLPCAWLAKRVYRKA